MLTDSSRSDAELWSEARIGNEVSFAMLFNRHRARVFSKAYACTRSYADAEDVVATVFLEAWRQRSKVHIIDGSLLPWLLSVTRYSVFNQTRSTRRWHRLFALAPDPQAEPDHSVLVLDRIDWKDQLRAVEVAMMGLTKQERTIVELCIFEELSVSVVATALGIPPGTVKSKLYRAREKIRRHVPEHLMPIATFDPAVQSNRAKPSPAAVSTDQDTWRPASDAYRGDDDSKQITRRAVSELNQTTASS